MEDVNSYLLKLLKKLDFSETESEKIGNSLSYLKQKIWSVFQNQLEDVVVFGSYDRGTALPVNIDKFLDVDVMIIFRKNAFQPQTYLNKLRNFGEKTYPKSDIFPDHPTIVVELDHIKFELVPAFIDEKFWGNKIVKIPAPPNKELKWITTNSDEFKAALLEKNKEKKGYTISIIKILKYWNVINDYPFRSYILEKIAVNENVSGNNLKECLFDFAKELGQYQKLQVEEIAYKSLIERLRRIKVLEKENISEYVEEEMKILLPEP